MATEPSRGKRARQARTLEKIPSDFPKFGAVFKHYKGNLYTVVGPCFQESTLDLHIMYHDARTGNAFVRPYREWIELVFISDTCRVRRFSHFFES